MTIVSAFKTDAAGLYVEQDPAATLRYGFDWTDQLALSGDTIVGSSWAVAAGLTKGATNYLGAKTTVTLSGGVLGQHYLVTNTIQLASGDTDVRSFRVFIKAR